ncbi:MULTISPECIES: ABC transporter permease [unclassified Clostridium]|uniref:ABC transporter permease n=1 Tax=unclassified Clostridium TaxID=2614128 RepID=UPI00257AA2EF|nr:MULTISPECIES: ABC transporter permease [unclassified Clostridium]
MLNLIYCELLKLRRSNMLLLSVLGVLSTPCMMLIEALQTHFKHPELVFTLADIYSDSLLYIMLLTNMMIYVAITAYLFSREYTENSLKTVLPIPVSRTAFVLGKFCVLFLWIVMLTLVTWAGILVLLGLYHIFIGMDGYDFIVASEWLLNFLMSSVLMFLTISPFAFIAEKTKGLVAPVVASAVAVMGSAALCNQDFGALYPWSATFFLLKGKIESTGYPILLSVGIIVFVSAIGFLATVHHFKKEDIK